MPVRPTYRFLNSGCRAGILAFVLYLLPSICSAQTVTAALDTTHYRIGEWIPLQLSAEVPAGAQITWPLIDNQVEDLEVLDRTPVDSANAGENKLYRQTLTLTVFDSGYYPVPAFDFIVDGDTLSTTPMLLRIHTVELDTAALDIRPIKDPIEVPLTFREILPWILLAAGILAVAALVWWFWKHRKKEPVERTEPAIVIPPHIWAGEQLHALKEEQLWQKGEVKAYYIKLTDILRRYIELRYGQPAMESTTEEIMDRLSVLSLPSALTERTRTMLVLSDFVKFAKAKPGPQEHEQSFDTAAEFVRATTETNTYTAIKEDPV